MDTVIVEFIDNVNKQSYDVQLPTFISGKELVLALAKAYNLPITQSDPQQLYLRSLNPTALITGDATLEDLGISNGTRIYFDKR